MKQLLGSDTLAQLRQRSNTYGWWSVLSCWASIIVTLTFCAWAETQSLVIAIPCFIVAIAVIGGRQLGLAILMHEASHRALFKSAWLNDHLADWLCARPVYSDVAKYRKHHMTHHSKTGTKDDSDISLVAAFPTTKKSLLRKFSRDLAGITGIKALIGLALMNADVYQWTVASDVKKLPRNSQNFTDYFLRFCRESYPTLITNLALYALMAFAGHPEFYLVWLVAYLIPNMLFIRIRAIAEHSVTENSSDTFRNTRTTKAGSLARAFFAPYNVNYHIEHHVMASVPYYRLPKLSQLLHEKGLMETPATYMHVMRIATSK